MDAISDTFDDNIVDEANGDVVHDCDHNDDVCDVYDAFDDRDYCDSDDD